MSIPTNNSKFVAMLLVLLSLFIFIFFTKGYYSSLIDTMNVYDENKEVHSTKLAELKQLNKKSKELENLAGANNNEIGKYLEPFSEESVIKEVYSYATQYSKNGGMKIISINISEPNINELGFNESKVTISARVENRLVMTDFLDYLIQDSKYKFYINSFNIPKGKNKFFNIQVPLTVFYKDATK